MGRERLKFAAVFAAGMVVAGLALHYLDSSPRDDDDAPSRAREIDRGEPAPEARVVTELSRRVAALERDGRKYNEAPVASGSPRREDEENESEASPFDPETLAAEEARVDRRFAFLSDQVRSENVDRAWAPQAVSEIELAAQDFPGSRLSRVDCRSTLCEVEVEHDDLRSSDRFVDFFFPHLPSLPRGALRRFRPEGRRPTTLVILARPGHALPRFEDAE